jgi:heme exporter protein B
VLLGKELRTEFRSRELLTTTVVFILTIVVLFSFTFDPSASESRRFGPGLLWLAFLFAASLMLQSGFLREQNNDTLSALRLSVSDPFSIFLAKLIANAIFLLLTEMLLLPIFAILYNVHILAVFPQLVLVFFLGSVGVAIPGTAFSAISAQARMRELMLPVLLLPLLTPVLIGSTEATAARREAGTATGLARFSGWIRRRVFDGAMAFRRISAGGMRDMQSPWQESVTGGGGWQC